MNKYLLAGLCLAASLSTTAGNLQYNSTGWNQTISKEDTTLECIKCDTPVQVVITETPSTFVSNQEFQKFALSNQQFLKQSMNNLYKTFKLN